ncbi:MAG TPA: hypothetical protein PKC18_01660 [Lacipirellulaceae bacterium]|nr:hypothetical protein [Lacipirellulaceae bacterium]
MKNKSTGVVILLLTVMFTRLAIGDGNGGPPDDPPNPRRCPSCSDEWTTEPVGDDGVECRHGLGASSECHVCYRKVIAETGAGIRIVFEETNDDNCCEISAGEDCWKQIKDPDGQLVFEEHEFGEFYQLVTIPGCEEEGACRCFKCVPNEGCEGRIEVRYLKCNEVEEHEPGWLCGGYFKICDKEELTTDISGRIGCPYRREKEAVTENDEPCNGENDDDGDSAVNTLLWGGASWWHTSCIGTNCTPVPGPWTVVEVVGALPKCNNPN